MTDDVVKQLDRLCTDGSQEAKRGFTGSLAVASSDLFIEGKTSARHHADSDKLFEGGGRLVKFGLGDPKLIPPSKAAAETASTTPAE